MRFFKQRYLHKGDDRVRREYAEEHGVKIEPGHVNRVRLSPEQVEQIKRDHERDMRRNINGD